MRWVLQYNPKNLEPSYWYKMDLDFCDCFVFKMDLDFWDCFGREEPHLITVNNMVMPMTDTNDC